MNISKLFWAMRHDCHNACDHQSTHRSRKSFVCFFTCMSVDLFAERRIPLKHALCGIVSVFLGHRALPGGKATNP